MFLTVYGPGLALRGPLGSMSRAVDGMKIEQSSMLNSYVWLIITFALSILASFWLVMKLEAAIVSSILFCIQAGGWYHYTLRIYNRFKFDAVDAGTFDDENEKQGSKAPTSR